MSDTYDLVVIGGGTGGYSAAIRGASLGLKTALVERGKVGGTCLHWGCIPTKALLHAGEILEEAREASQFGITIEGASYDWSGVQAYKDKVVTKMYRGLGSLIKHKKIEVIEGSGTITGPGKVSVGDRTIEATNIVVATGSVPKMLPGLEVSDRILTSDQALVTEVPKSAIVLGGGAIGVEFASVWSSFGAEVTVVEMLPNLVPLEDADLGKELAKQLTKRGIKVHVGAKLSDIKETKDGVTAVVEQDGKRTETSAEVLLVAVGRGPVTKGVGLENIGVTVDNRGYIPVNEDLLTSAEGVYAVGDVLATPMLAHVSFAEGMYVAEHIAGKSPTRINYDAVPRATYCSPEVGAVGLTEAEAIERGFEVETKTVSLQGIGKAVILSGTGFCKIVTEKGGRILGAHFIGPRVTELVAEAMISVGWEAIPDDVAQLIHPHPSLSEVFGEAALSISGRALHTG